MAAPKKSSSALSAAAAKKAQAPKEPELDESFGDESEGAEDKPGEGVEAKSEPAKEEEPAEPEVRTRKHAAVETRKDAAAKKAPLKVVPTDDYVRDRKGNVRVDEDGDKMRYAAGFHRQVGFVNENGVRFPPGYKFKGGHVGTFGNVILNRCPRCGHQQSVDEAREGRCGNLRAGVERRPCGYDQVAELEEITLDDVGE